MHCVDTITLSFIINEELKGFVKPSGGIHQGDYISLYLFLVYAEGLSY